MYNEELEGLIEAALADGVLTDKEKQILFKKADSFGIDHDEFEMVLNARLAKVQRVQQPTRAAKEKIGNIVTCPNCGAQIPGGAAKCPECGFEFRNTDANRSAQRFCDGLQSASDKKMYISTFPVPNTADDLLEFLSLVQGKARKHKLAMFNEESLSSESILEQAYWELYGNCINKAKFNFANDPRFIPYFEDYEKRGKKTSDEIKMVGILVAFMIIGFLVLAIFN